MSRDVAYQANNPGRLPVPKVLETFMFVIFSFPVVVTVLSTLTSIPKNPLLLLLWIAACFPLAVLIVAKKLMARYALRVYNNGDLQIVYPFKTQDIEKTSLTAIDSSSTYNRQANRTLKFWHLIGRDNNVLASISQSVFPTEQWQQAFATLRKLNPSLRLSSNS